MYPLCTNYIQCLQYLQVRKYSSTYKYLAKYLSISTSTLGKLRKYLSKVQVLSNLYLSVLKYKYSCTWPHVCMVWIEINCSVNQSSCAEPSPPWHNKSKWAGTGWPGLGYNVNAFWVDQLGLPIIIATAGHAASIFYIKHSTADYNVPRDTPCLQ